MSTRKDLVELGKNLAIVDRTIVGLLARRMEVAREVEEYKRWQGEPIFRAGIEDQRLADVDRWARELGVNPHFARAILYFIIGESCKTQIIQLQTRPAHPIEEDEERRFEFQRAHLLELTAACASAYSAQYHQSSPATGLYLDFEQQIIQELVERMDNRNLMVDLGCATGRYPHLFHRKFKIVHGYDVSYHMVMQASAEHNHGNVRYYQLDLECQEIPETSHSVSLVLMTLGTASDIRNLKRVLEEIKRVLRPGGQVFLSFYNANALAYRLNFLPWPLSLAAQLNIPQNCLEVHWGENQIFSIHARAYTDVEVEELFTHGLHLDQIFTHPVISPILPNELLHDETVRIPIGSFDQMLARDGADSGAYIIAIGSIS